jgi:large subunit ribosomal protein L25
MAGERIKIQVQPRERVGSRESRRMRRGGFVPGVLYGRVEAKAIMVEERELRRALTGGQGLHAILDVVLDGGDGKPHPSILKHFQQDPVRGKLLHVDLQEVRLDQPIQAAVTITLLGADDAPGVREGGVISLVNREVNVEALPMEVPEHIDVDVSGMAMGDTLRLAEVRVPENVKLLDDPEETVIATLTMPTRVVEPEPVEEEEAVEGEVPEGEEAPEGAAEAPAGGEPEGGEPEGKAGTVEG